MNANFIILASNKYLLRLKINNMIIIFDFTRVSLHTIMINVHDSSNNQQMIQSSEKGKVL